ncbi:MAG: hypothetical protein ACTTKZ_04910 [Bacteroides sp.]
MEIQILLLALLPSILVLLSGLLSYRYLAKALLRRDAVEQTLTTRKLTLPIRLQAYERLTLLMERISPENLLIRCEMGDYSAKEYEMALLADIRQEWEHNLSQQIYVSNEVWQQVRQAKGNVSKMVSMCGEKVHPASPANELSKMILAMLLELNTHPTSVALVALRSEASRLL